MKRPLVFLVLVLLAVALVCGAAGAPRAAALSFAPYVNHGVGASPFFVTVGDVNGDGKADLLTTNPIANSVSVLLGDGKGGFTSPVPGPPTFATGAGPFSLATGDFDSDIDVDLVTGDNTAATASVLLNNGAGVFGAPGALPAGAGPRAVVVDDFDGNTTLDFAVLNNGANSVTVYLGNGAGAFMQPLASPFPTGASPVGMVAGDFNGDTVVDLATADSGPSAVGVLLGIGNGGFLPPLAFPTGTGPFGLVAADFDSNGSLDLATDNPGANTVSVLLNTSVPPLLSFAPKVDTFAGPIPFGLAAADFDGDGRCDLATVTGWPPFASDATVLLGDGSGGFPTVQTFASPDYFPQYLAAGDLNGGKPDLAVANTLTGADSVSVLLNTTKARIVSIKPARGKPGATVTITGAGFGAARGKTKVYFGGKAVSKYVSWSPTKIKVKVPKTAAGKKAVTVRSVEGKSNAKTFRVM